MIAHPRVGRTIRTHYRIRYYVFPPARAWGGLNKTKSSIWTLIFPPSRVWGGH
jgi:hypothetical protein